MRPNSPTDSQTIVFISSNVVAAVIRAPNSAIFGLPIAPSIVASTVSKGFDEMTLQRRSSILRFVIGEMIQSAELSIAAIGRPMALLGTGLGSDVLRKVSDWAGTKRDRVSEGLPYRSIGGATLLARVMF